jgi:XapX domain-containing protein
MSGYLISLLMGLAVGAAYGLLHVRSPAPPLIALVGLLGMVLGEQAIDAWAHHRPPRPPAPTWVRPLSDSAASPK